MIELKAFDVGLGQYCEDGSPCVVAFDADRNPRLLNEKVYLKSEADKVIAELKEENEKLKATPEQIMKEVFDKCLIYPKEMVRLDDAYKLAVSLRKQKYKRCLAMAGWCEATALWCYQAANTLPTGFHATLFGKPVMIETDRLYNRFELLTKWSNRWMKLAKNFKEAK